MLTSGATKPSPTSECAMCDECAMATSWSARLSSAPYAAGAAAAVAGAGASGARVHGMTPRSSCVDERRRPGDVDERRSGDGGLGPCLVWYCIVGMGERRETPWDRPRNASDVGLEASPFG